MGGCICEITLMSRYRGKTPAATITCAFSKYSILMNTNINEQGVKTKGVKATQRVLKSPRWDLKRNLQSHKAQVALPSPHPSPTSVRGELHQQMLLLFFSFCTTCVGL